MKKLQLLHIPFGIALLLIVTGTLSCKKSSLNNNVTVNVTGNWQGTLVGVLPDEGGNTAMTLEQSGVNITGSFSITNVNGKTPTAGTLKGTVNGYDTSLILTAVGANGGDATLNGTINTVGNLMSGTFTGSGTGGSGSGTWNLTKN